ncbi:MAG: hypothetical protein ABI123_04615 [Ginsengibacter sp.]|jgi:PBP1b-binding outer membrane lipoprotein LpoB
MKKVIVKFQPVVWILVIILALFFTSGCDGNSKKTEVHTTTEPMTAPVVTEPQVVKPADSLPPIDDSAKPRPLDRKTIQ